VNLYPFEQTIQKDGVTIEEAIEQIDIGGPSLIRATAKNHAFTTVATSPNQYDSIIAELKSNQGTTLKLRRKLAAECFAQSARYDACIAEYMQEQLESQTSSTTIEMPQGVSIAMQLKSTLRYGENPHQSAALYRLPSKR